jgi:hypothetical protein
MRSSRLGISIFVAGCDVVRMLWTTRFAIRAEAAVMTVCPACSKERRDGQRVPVEAFQNLLAVPIIRRAVRNSVSFQEKAGSCAGSNATETIDFILMARIKRHKDWHTVAYNSKVALVHGQMTQWRSGLSLARVWNAWAASAQVPPPIVTQWNRHGQIHTRAKPFHSRAVVSSEATYRISLARQVVNIA